MSPAALTTPASASCWTEIGTWGPHGPTCDRLAAVVHCRNCPVYASVGRAVLDGEMGEPQLDAHTRAVASPPRSSLDVAHRAVVLFRVGEEWFGLPAEGCITVAPVGPVHRIPSRGGGALLGLTPVRGRLLLCVALGKLLHIEGEAPSLEADATRLIVVGPENEPWAFPAAEIAGVERIDRATVKEASSSLGRDHLSLGDGVVRIGERRISLLNPRGLAAAVTREVGA